MPNERCWRYRSHAELNGHGRELYKQKREAPWSQWISRLRHEQVIVHRSQLVALPSGTTLWRWVEGTFTCGYKPSQRSLFNPPTITNIEEDKKAPNQIILVAPFTSHKWTTNPRPGEGMASLNHVCLWWLDPADGYGASHPTWQQLPVLWQPGPTNVPSHASGRSLWLSQILVPLCLLLMNNNEWVS